MHNKRARLTHDNVDWINIAVYLIQNDVGEERMGKSNEDHSKRQHFEVI